MFADLKVLKNIEIELNFSAFFSWFLLTFPIASAFPLALFIYSMFCLAYLHWSVELLSFYQIIPQIAFIAQRPKKYNGRKFHHKKSLKFSPKIPKSQPQTPQRPEKQKQLVLFKYN